MASGTPRARHRKDRPPAAPTCSHVPEKKGIRYKVQDRYILRATARTALDALTSTIHRVFTSLQPDAAKHVGQKDVRIYKLLSSV
jgi:hypothetical protein